MATLESGKDPFNGVSNLDQSPARYAEIIYGFNQLIHAELKQAFAKASGSLYGVEALAIPGSDGRFEKGSLVSQVEVIALLPENVPNIDALKSRVVSAVQKASPTRIAHFEWKQFGTQMSAYNGDKNRIQPARVATDARFIWGSHASLERARRQIGQEVLSEEGRRIKEKVGGLKRDAGIAMSGKNRISQVDAVHFELESKDGSGAVFFNPKAFQLSFKIGPLRLVQNTLLAESIKHVRQSGDADFLKNLRSNISNRLTQLSDDKLSSLNRDSVNAIINHYNFFLRLYHRSEQAYMTRKETVLALTPNEVLEVKRRITDLAQLMSNYKIGRMN